MEGAAIEAEEPTIACRNKALGCSSLLANQKSERRHAVRCKFKPADANRANSDRPGAAIEAEAVVRFHCIVLFYPVGGEWKHEAPPE